MAKSFRIVNLETSGSPLNSINSSTVFIATIIELEERLYPSAVAMFSLAYVNFSQPKNSNPLVKVKAKNNMKLFFCIFILSDLYT